MARVFFAAFNRMDFSQYIRLKNEAANTYVSRMKTIDSSFLTLQRQQKSAYAGYAASSSVAYDISSCPIYTMNTGGVGAGKGFTSVDKQGTHENLILRAGGCAVCHDTDYSTASPGIQLKTYTEASTILAQYNLNPGSNFPKPYGYGLKPGEWKPYGYGQNHYFPNTTNCPNPNDSYPPAAWPYK